MNKLLKIEWLKLKNYTAFIVIASCFAVGVLATNYIVFLVNKNIVSQVQGAGLMGASYSPYNFDNTWQTTSYVTGWLLMLPAMLLIILCTNEFTYRTHRQNIIDGISRLDFVNVKLVMALIEALASTVLVIVTALLLGAFSGSAFSLNSFSHVGYFFLKALSYNMIAVLMSVLIRRTGFAIGVFFIYLGVENLIAQLLDVWSMKIRSSNNVDLGSIGDYLPMNAADGLLTFPENTLKSMTKTVLPTDYTLLVLGLAIGYLVLFFWWSRRRMQQSDL
ncbi:MAG: hypothetical protein ACRC3K_00035, partial [Plesiomonas sp.]